MRFGDSEVLFTLSPGSDEKECARATGCLSLLVLSVKHAPCHKRSSSSTLLTDQIRLWRDKKNHFGGR